MSGDAARHGDASAVAFRATLLPWGLAAAAGAMLTVTLVDVLPEMRAQWRLHRQPSFRT